MMNLACGTDLIVFSSDKFGWEDLRTSALMKEFALKKRVYFFEQPIMGVSRDATYMIKKEDHEVCLIQPYLPAETSIFEQKLSLLNLLKELITDEQISHYTIWTDTPKAMHFIRQLSPEIIIYDCLNDYSIASAALEAELFEYADVVLTSAMSNSTAFVPGRILIRQEQVNAQSA
jgi:UDP-galactopyranose mutase